MATPGRDDQDQAEVRDLSPKKRFESALVSGLWSDITFVVGKNSDEVKAHKLILSIGSKVFEDMFKENIGTWSVLEVPDLEPWQFKLLLKYMYTGKCEILNSNRVEILQVAFKYQVKELVQLCTQQLGKILKNETAIQVLREAICYENKDLEESALKLICRNVKYFIFQTSRFLKFSADELVKILERDDLELDDDDELRLFKALMRWGKAECKRKGKSWTPEYMRSALEPVIHLIRFPLMDPSDFALEVAPTKVLLTEEMVTVLLHLCVKPELKHQVSSGPFNSKPRKAAARSKCWSESLKRRTRFSFLEELEAP